MKDAKSIDPVDHKAFLTSIILVIISHFPLLVMQITFKSTCIRIRLSLKEAEELLSKGAIEAQLPLFSLSSFPWGNES